MIGRINISKIRHEITMKIGYFIDTVTIPNDTSINYKRHRKLLRKKYG